MAYCRFSAGSQCEQKTQNEIVLVWGGILAGQFSKCWGRRSGRKCRDDLTGFWRSIAAVSPCSPNRLRTLWTVRCVHSYAFARRSAVHSAPFLSEILDPDVCVLRLIGGARAFLHQVFPLWMFVFRMFVFREINQILLSVVPSSQVCDGLICMKLKDTHHPDLLQQLFMKREQQALEFAVSFHLYRRGCHFMSFSKSYFLFCLVSIFVAATAPAADRARNLGAVPAPPVAGATVGSEFQNLLQLPQEHWQSLSLMGTKIGYTHTYLEKSDYQGQAVLRIRMEMVMNLKALGTDVTLEMTRVEYTGYDLMPRHFLSTSNESGSKKVEGRMVDGIGDALAGGP